MNKNDLHYRPFVCDGDAIESQAFLVGINPATSMPAGSFRRNCFDGRHFNYQRWREEYIAHRRKLGSTRKCIEIVSGVCSSRSIQLLETNVWSYEAPKPKGVPQQWRTVESLVALLNAAKPRVVVFHGGAIAKARTSLGWQQLAETLTLADYPDNVADQVGLGWREVQPSWGPVSVRVSRHLSRLSHAAARQLGENICARILPPLGT